MSVLCLCAVAGAAAAGAAGCSANSANGFSAGGSLPAPSNAAGDNGSGSGGASNGADNVGGQGASTGSGAPTLPPEMKTESTYRSPIATGNVVWIANPTSGRVAYIDATTFAVQTVGAGNGPTYLAAVPDPTDDVAIVLNVLSQDATILRDHQGTLSTTTLPSTPDANAWSVSSNGKWAVAWTDATQVPTAAPTQSFQDIAVMNLATATTSFLNVGYRPSQIAFSGDSAAYAVTQDGITVIDLTGAQPAVTKNLPLPASAPPATADGGPDAASEAGAEAGADAARQALPDASLSDAAQAPSDAGEDAPQPVGTPAQSTPDASAVGATPDVSFTPDGAYALVRLDGLPSVTVIALATGTSTTIPLPSAPTDLTISPAGDFAMAVLRDQSEVVTLPLPGIVSNPASMTVTTVPGQVIGRAIVTKKGTTALLFTTVGQGPKGALTVLTLKPTPSYRTVTLYAPVLAVFPTDDEANAIVLHDVTPDPASGVVGAFSMVPLALDLPAVLSSLPASPTAVAIAPTSDYALVSIRDDASGQFGIYMGLMPSLRVIPVPLASPPIAVGIVAGAARGYAAQDYSEGRVTFVNLAQSGCDGSTECVSARTITGFELGARVVNGNGSMP